MTNNRITKAVIPVAGFGTRVLPASKSIPKELFPIFDKAVIDYVVEEAKNAGITHFVFVTGRGKGAIENHFDQNFELNYALERGNKTDILNSVKNVTLDAGQAFFTRQTDMLGLGHAILCAKDAIGQAPFAILLPDVITDATPGCLAQMVAHFNTAPDANFIATEAVPKDQTDKYGIVKTDGDASQFSEIQDMVEKPKPNNAPSNMAITGRYILQPEIFGLLESAKKGVGGEIQLTDSMQKLMEEQTFYSVPYNGQSFDCGNKIGYLSAFIHFAMNDIAHGKDARETIQQALT